MVNKEKSNHNSVGLLRKNRNPQFPYNHKVAVPGLKSLKNKFKKEPEFYEKI